LPPQNIPLISTTGHLALQIFPNLFLGETGEINALRAKKFGIVDFRIWRVGLRLWLPGL
jgi:hypothetical protein